MKKGNKSMLDKMIFSFLHIVIIFFIFSINDLWYVEKKIIKYDMLDNYITSSGNKTRFIKIAIRKLLFILFMEQNK